MKITLMSVLLYRFVQQSVMVKLTFPMINAACNKRQSSLTRLLCCYTGLLDFCDTLTAACRHTIEILMRSGLVVTNLTVIGQL
jgi:hypothetical protein